ncbi:RteC domain-containing protein [Chryseobacterium luquanense]|uniref:RteC domain-containing protein n=1 Tax=Chryseobacterium luquanense TaxID=2983766 RepID=A0ABT3XXY1_9FLAO|nr:RteC domain-containing protein [Chryseobacterium luquanense]MCX8530751.1 RteC domain-containing protein [Chryseobacterium luquanense]
MAIYIYYSKILSIEASKPFIYPMAFRSYYESERNNLLYFYSEEKEFISCYRRKSTFLDKKYFIRFKFDFKLKLSPELYNYNVEFSTSHDHLVSQIIANDFIDGYLTSKINSDDNQENSIRHIRKLEWTAPKLELTELLYALHQTNCFNECQDKIMINGAKNLQRGRQTEAPAKIFWSRTLRILKM